MNCFAIHIEPLAPVGLGRRLNLDAILAYLLLQRFRAAGVEEDEALHRAHAEIPLAQSNSVFAGSSALIPRTRATNRTIYGSLQRHLTAIPNVEDVLEKNIKNRANGRDFNRIENLYQTIFSTYTEHHLHKPNDPDEDDRDWGLWFVGYGDRSAIEGLMGDLRYIGKKRTPIRPPVFYDADPGVCPGLLGRYGTVLRPVPCSIDQSKFAPKRFSKAHERFRPPYWRSSLAQNPVLCYVPPVNVWPNRGNIKEIIGVI